MKHYFRENKLTKSIKAKKRYNKYSERLNNDGLRSLLT